MVANLYDYRFLSRWLPQVDGSGYKTRDVQELRSQLKHDLSTYVSTHTYIHHVTELPAYVAPYGK